MKKTIVIIFSIIILILAWYLVSPIFINQTVQESLPVFSSENASQEILNENPMLETQEPVRIQENQEIPNDIILGQDVLMNDPMVSAPEQEIKSEHRGVFSGADSSHKGQGDLLVLSSGDSQFLRFENFSVTNGPDLFVTLNKGNDPKGEHVIVAALKGNIGDQNYDVSEYDLSEYQSVSIYCRAFSTEFATAEL